MSVKIIWANLERGRQIRYGFAASTRSKKSGAERVVGRCVFRTNTNRLREIRGRLRDLAANLQQRPQVVMRFEVVRILLKVVASHRFLNQRSRVGPGSRRIFR